MISKFNEKGQSAWLELLGFLKDKPERVLKESALIASNEEFIEQLDGELNLAGITKRLDLAMRLDEAIEANGLRSHVGDTHFWNWIAANSMSTLVKSDPRTDIGKKLGKSNERWNLTPGTLRYHRHLVSSPYFAYVDNRRNLDVALCLLISPILEPGEVVERISGKKAFTTGSICELATLLYVDKTSNQFKSGITSAPGHPKGFARFFSQLDKNVDYQSMSADELMKLLPESFDRWKA